MKKMMIVTFAFLNITFFANAQDKNFGSCTFEDGQSCVDFIGSEWGEDLEISVRECENMTGEYSQYSCNPNAAVGYCSLGKETEIEMLISFYQPYTSEVAEEGCASLGGVYRQNN